MLNDIMQTPVNVTVGNKNYSFEFDHSSLAVLEKRTGKSIYEIYDNIIATKNVMMNDAEAMAYSAMLKHHSSQEIFEVTERLQEHPGFWNDIKMAVITAFVTPMLPPEIMEQIDSNNKKKVRKKAQSVSRKKKE